MLWYGHEWTRFRDTEENKLLNEVVIFVFFAHKKYSQSLLKLRLNHGCHMDYFNDVLPTDLGLEHGSCMEGQKALGFHHKYLNLCSKDEQRSFRFETTWGWDFRFFWWTIPLKLQIKMANMSTFKCDSPFIIAHFSKLAKLIIFLFTPLCKH